MSLLWPGFLYLLLLIPLAIANLVVTGIVLVLLKM